MEQCKIVIVDDEPDILEFLEYNLEKEGYRVRKARNGKEAVELVKRFQPEIVLMDIMMAEMDGIEACHTIRNLPLKISPYIIFLTANAEEFTEVAAWEAGGNDFLSKPIKPRALLSRLKYIRKGIESDQAKMDRIEMPDLVIDRSNYTVRNEKTTFILTKKEFELLYYLAQYANVVKSRDQILQHVWEEDTYVLPRTVDVHVRKLRENLGSHYIKTIQGVGYMFVK